MAVTIICAASSPVLSVLREFLEDSAAELSAPPDMDVEAMAPAT